jgi:8-oxo-dGTP diphosphatase
VPESEPQLPQPLHSAASVTRSDPHPAYGNDIDAPSRSFQRHRRSIDAAGGAPEPWQYAVCNDEGRVLLARWVSRGGGTHWTLPGGQVKHGEDPFDAVIRQVAEETGGDAAGERLLGVGSRLIPSRTPLARPATAPERRHLYRVRITGGHLRPEPNGETAESVWTPIPDVMACQGLRREDPGPGVSPRCPGVRFT